MFTAAAVCTSIYLKGLGITLLLLCFCADMMQLPSVMADVKMFILKDLVCHAVIFTDIFCLSTCFAFFVILQLYITGYFILLQINQVFFAAIAMSAVTSSRLSLKAFLCFSKTGIRVL